MSRQQSNVVCATLPGAVLEHPFGPNTDTWKVGGKIFALVAQEGVSLKCRDTETATMLIDISFAVPAPYLKRGGWIRITWESITAGRVSLDDLTARLALSYETVRASLPKRARPPLDDKHSGRS